MNKPLERFAPVEFWDGVQMIADESGEWVRFEDADRYREALVKAHTIATTKGHLDMTNLVNTLETALHL